MKKHLAISAAFITSMLAVAVLAPVAGAADYHVSVGGCTLHAYTPSSPQTYWVEAHGQIDGCSKYKFWMQVSLQSNTGTWNNVGGSTRTASVYRANGIGFYSNPVTIQPSVWVRTKSWGYVCSSSTSCSAQASVTSNARQFSW